MAYEQTLDDEFDGYGILGNATNSEAMVQAMANPDLDIADELVAGNSSHISPAATIPSLEKAGVVYPGCDTVYPGATSVPHEIVRKPSNDASNQPLVLENAAVMPLGCNTVYPAASVDAMALPDHEFGDASNGPVQLPGGRGMLYPGCDTIYPVPSTGATTASEWEMGEASNGPIYVPEKQGIMYPGSDIIYPATSTNFTTPEVSPEYSTYNPSAVAPTLTSPSIPPQSGDHTYEPFSQTTVTSNLGTQTTGIINPKPQNIRTYDPNAYSHPATTSPIQYTPTSSHDPGTTSMLSLDTRGTSLMTQNTSNSLEKPSMTSPESSTSDLDSDGFTAAERLEHIRSVRYLFYLRLLVWYRLSIRAATIFISLAVFSLTLVAITLFLHIADEHDTSASTSDVTLSPHKAFASISGVFTLVSLSLNIACCFSKRIRYITPLSNVIFAVVSVAGTLGWLSGCLYLHRAHSSRNLWYYACSAADTYTSATGSGGSARRSLLPFGLSLGLNRRTYSDADKRLARICNFTQNAWDLGILQICFEILTFINAAVAIVMVRMGLARRRSSRGRKCFA